MQVHTLETFLRVRPRLAKHQRMEYRSKEVVLEDNQSTRGIFDIQVPEDAHPGLVHGSNSGMLSFEFDGIFDESTSQDDIFNAIARDKILNLLNGENSTIFAYGQTGKLYY